MRKFHFKCKVCQGQVGRRFKILFLPSVPVSKQPLVAIVATVPVCIGVPMKSSSAPGIRPLLNTKINLSMVKIGFLNSAQTTFEESHIGHGTVVIFV